nr:MAG TPA: hypothetical protein [Bacteriophage sp.]
MSFFCNSILNCLFASFVSIIVTSFLYNSDC